MVSLLLTLKIFHTVFCDSSIVDFERVNINWAFVPKLLPIFVTNYQCLLLLFAFPQKILRMPLTYFTLLVFSTPSENIRKPEPFRCIQVV